MALLKRTSLYLTPSKGYVEALIVPLNDELIDSQIHLSWWRDESLVAHFDIEPIDRDWDWHEPDIDYEGRPLNCRKFAIVAGGEVQGAMMISAEPVLSILTPDQNALFVERLCTAPRNRRDLRHDGQDYLKGVGVELLTYAAELSRDKGCGGRLLLDASPDFVTWYQQKVHFINLDREPTLYEGVTYTPMELPVAGADRLLSLWTTK